MNKNIITCLAILGIASLLLVVLIVFFLLPGIKQESENLISQKRLLAELETKAKNLKEFEETYQTYQPNLQKIDQLFINVEEPISFIEFLEKQANNSSLSIEIAPFPSKKAKDDPWSSTSFRLALAGSFPNFLRFLEKIELSSYLINLSNLNLKSDADGVPGDINTSFLIKVYTKK